MIILLCIKEKNSILQNVRGGVKMVKGYCVKCRVKKDMEKITETELKNGRPAFYGFCPDCKTKMFRIGDLAAAKKKELTGGG